MIRVLLFDLGETLVDAQQRPYPHVEAALDAVARFRTAAGTPLRSALVSDFTLVPPPVTTARVRPVFDEYLAILGRTGLRPPFEPVDRRVTLSTHAGVLKPAAAVFEKALSRLRSRAGLADCLLVTENAAHVDHARRKLGMQALQFRKAGVAGFDFADWSQFPALVEHAMAAAHPDNLGIALRAHLAAHGLDVDPSEAQGGREPWRVNGRRWTSVTLPKLGAVDVAVPAQAQLRRGPRGDFLSELAPPRPEDAAAAAEFAHSLAAQGQIAEPHGATGARTTHAIETGADGRRRLMRRRFSAI